MSLKGPVRASLLVFGLATGFTIGCGGSDDDENGGDGDSGDGDGDGGIQLGDGDGDSGNKRRVQGCNDLDVEFETVVPTVMLLVDRSSSMFDQPFAPYPNRWLPLKEALVGDDGAVTQLEGGVRFGFAAYTHQSINGPAQCPLFDHVDIALDNHGAIKDKYDKVSSDPIDPSAPLQGTINPTKGETPTGAAVQVAAGHLSQYAGAGPKFLLVVTDGEPDTCAVPDPQCGQDEAIAAVQAAHAAGIGTFVIGVGEIGVNHLQDLANAGLGLPVQQRTPPESCTAPFNLATYSAQGGDAQVFNPANPDALKADIAGIVGNFRSCTYTLNEEVSPDKANLGTVLVNDAEAIYDDANGWRMNSTTELELLGASCEAVKTVVDPDVYISFPCDVFVK